MWIADCLIQSLSVAISAVMKGTCLASLFVLPAKNASFAS
jgi:hypothetical protein